MFLIKYKFWQEQQLQKQQVYLLQPVQTLGTSLVGLPQYGACSRLWKKWHEATSTQPTLLNPTSLKSSSTGSSAFQDKRQNHFKHSSRAITRWFNPAHGPEYNLVCYRAWHEKHSDGRQDSMLLLTGSSTILSSVTTKHTWLYGAWVIEPSSSQTWELKSPSGSDNALSQQLLGSTQGQSLLKLSSA